MGNIACNMGPDSGFQWFEIVGSILYVEWGLVHIAAMILLILPSSRNNLTETYKGVYDKYCGDPENAKDYEALAGKWPKHAGRVYMQHALNLGFAGVLACLAPALIASAVWSRFLWTFQSWSVSWDSFKPTSSALACSASLSLSTTALTGLCLHLATLRSGPCTLFRAFSL